jgi:hypothetical protein
VLRAYGLVGGGVKFSDLRAGQWFRFTGSRVTCRKVDAERYTYYAIDAREWRDGEAQPDQGVIIVSARPYAKK